MKTTKSSLIVMMVSIFIGVASLAAAQQTHPKPPPIPDEAQLTKMIEQLSKELSLDDNQKEKIKILHTEHFKQVKILHIAQKKQREAAKEKHHKLRSDFETKIEKELSKEQFEQFKKIMAEKHKRKGQKRPKR